MATIDNNPSSISNKGRNIRKSIHLDLTPMVDLGFILITFFVFTTTMSEAKIMESIQPKDNGHDVSAESTTTTFIIGAKDTVYYYFGKLDYLRFPEQIQFTTISNVRDVIVQKKQRHHHQPNALMFLIKATDESTFGNSIDLLDEMAICNIPRLQFMETDISTSELEALSVLSRK